MKLHILADLHNEFGIFHPPTTDADIVILGGDIDVGLRGLSWAYNAFHGRTVIYVAGNHENYQLVLPSHTKRMREYASDLGIHFLENDALVIDDIAFLGCTLWSDFALFGNVPLAMMAAEQQMMDYRVIRKAPSYRRLRARDTLQLHKASLTWLQREVQLHKDKKIVVCTHNAPSLRSIAERYKSDVLSASFASALDDFVETSGIHMWVHGHVHDCVSYQAGSTRVVANVRGYPREYSERFDGKLVIEV
jgi:Icc-related predicted phosphoesterase